MEMQVTDSKAVFGRPLTRMNCFERPLGSEAVTENKTVFRRPTNAQRWTFAMILHRLTRYGLRRVRDQRVVCVRPGGGLHLRGRRCAFPSKIPIEGPFHSRKVTCDAATVG